MEAIGMSLLGGALIGLGASALLLVTGKIAGVSGIVAGVLSPERGEVLWRALFVAGLVVGGIVAKQVTPNVFDAPVERPWFALALAGLLVGFGARLGNGCTSGHAVSGIGRLSKRSFTAAAVFVGSGVATVAAARWLGGAS